MSETTEETTTETTEPAVEPVPDSEPDTELEPDAPLEPESEPIQGDDADQPEEGEGQPAAPDTPEAMSEKEFEIRGQKLGNENARHAKRVGEIMEEDATLLIPCPVCMDNIAGWIFPPEVQKLPDEAIARIRQVIGLPDYTSFKDAEDARTCPGCDGLGKVKTGSAVPGREVKDCVKCNGAGWINLAYQSNGTAAPAPDAPIVTGPTVYGTDEPDDRVRGLREEGWFLTPPLNLQQS